MQILKRPDNVIFDTENPDYMEFNPTPNALPTALHHLIAKSEWDFLTEFFKPRQGIQHPIFRDFSNSHFYCISVGYSKQFRHGRLLKLPALSLPTFADFSFNVSYSQNSDIEIIKIEADRVAEASIYCYLDGNSAVFLSNLKVEPDYQKKGIGTFLQDIREQIGRDVKATHSNLWVKKRSWMRDWYKRRGYIEYGPHPQKGYIWLRKSLD